MAEEGEELKGYYERKIRNLEEALEKALQAKPILKNRSAFCAVLPPRMRKFW